MKVSLRAGPQALTAVGDEWLSEVTTTVQPTAAQFYLAGDQRDVFFWGATQRQVPQLCGLARSTEDGRWMLV